MSVLGSVKDRIKTRFIINRNIQKKKDLEEEAKKDKIKEEKKVEQKVATSILSQSINIAFNDDIKKNIDVEEEIIFPAIRRDTIKTSNEITIPEENQIEEKNEVLESKEPLTLSETLEDTKEIEVPTEKNKIKEYVKVFIDNTKKEIKKLKKELKEEELLLKKVKDDESLEKEKAKIEESHKKIMHLKEVINGLLEKYEFNSYEEIKDELLLRYIDDFEFKSETSIVDTLVEECKTEIAKVEGISELTHQLLEVESKQEKKQSKLYELSIDYNNRINDYDYLDRSKEKIKRFIEKEAEYLENLSRELNDTTIEKRIETHLVFDKQYVNHLLSLGVGLASFQTSFIGAFIGAFLVKNATTNLLRGAFKEKSREVYSYKYHEYIEKIDNNLDLVETTIYLINNSIEDLSKFKDYIETNYKGYLKNEKYNELYQKVIKMLKELLLKKEKAEKSKKDLLEKKEKNKTRQKKIDKMNIEP